MHAYLARHISRHINILHSALYHEDKKHVCSSAYQMLSPSLFVCQLNATSATAEPLGSSSAYHLALLSYPFQGSPPSRLDNSSPAYLTLSSRTLSPVLISSPFSFSLCLSLSLHSRLCIICFRVPSCIFNFSFTRSRANVASGSG